MSRPLPLRSALLLVAAIATLVAPAAAQPVLEPVPRDEVRGEVINFETPLIRPLLVTEDGEQVVAIHEPDQRVVFRTPSLGLIGEVRAGQGLTALAQRPGTDEIWASAMHSSAVMVIDATTRRVTHVLSPPAGVELGLGDRATPAGIAFSADGAKAWVAAASTDVLVVWDAAAKQHLKTVPLAVEHNGRSTRIKEPRAVVADGEAVYVAAYRSGNQTLAGPVAVFGIHPDVIDLAEVDGLSLPDADILALSAVDESPLFHQKGVGSLILGLALHPDSGELLATSMDARNAEFLGEGAFPQGRVALNRLTLAAPGEAPSEYARVALEDLPASSGTAHVAMPTDLATDASGRIYVAGYASANIGVFDASGALVDVLPSDRGPRGLALSPDGATLYALNRIDGTITMYGVGDVLPDGPDLSVPIGLHDPTFDRVVQGRALYHRASNSGGGSTGCFSCHPDLQSDGLGWDLSAYFDLGEGFTPENPPRFWKDRKFAMTTQDARSLEDSLPYHWRGEQKDLSGFNGAFEGLLKGERLSDLEFARLQDYVFSGLYPANPLQAVDRKLSLQAKAGSLLFRFSEATCAECHALPIGARGAISSAFVSGNDRRADGQLVAMDTPQLRGLWTKESDLANLVEDGAELPVPVTGFGTDHAGSHHSVRGFVEAQFEEFPEDQREGLIDFLEEFDSGLAPTTSWAERLDSTTAAGFDGDFLVEQALAESCDLVVFGRADLGQGFRDLAAVFDRDLGEFVPDDATVGHTTMDQLVDWASQGRAELVVLGVPVGSGERIGVDRDRDGLFDTDEVALGTSPHDPDTDGDGFWDSYDDDPLVPGDTVADDAAPQVSDVVVRFATANSVRITYETDTFSPTRVVFGETADYDREVGDPFPLAAGSNHWKRVHSIVLRALDDGTTYRFRIETQGQNGVFGQSEEMTATTLSDATSGSPATVRVRDIALEQTGFGPDVLTATVEVVTNSAEPVPDAEVRGFWTLFVAGEPVAQEPSAVGVTDGAGIAVIDFELDGSQPVDHVSFTVPMFVVEGGEDRAGVIDVLQPERRFAWPESLVSHVETTVE